MSILQKAKALVTGGTDTETTEELSVSDDDAVDGWILPLMVLRALDYDEKRGTSRTFTLMQRVYRAEKSLVDNDIPVEGYDWFVYEDGNEKYPYSKAFYEHFRTTFPEYGDKPMALRDITYTFGGHERGYVRTSSYTDEYISQYFDKYCEVSEGTVQELIDDIVTKFPERTPRTDFYDVLVDENPERFF